MLVTGTRPVDEDFLITLDFGIKYKPSTIKKLGLTNDTHQGIDFGTPLRTPVRAYKDGLIQIAREGTDGFGKRIWLYCDLPGEKNAIRLGYCHLAIMMVSAGHHVKEGQIIAYTGDSGKVDGPHLHFEGRILPADTPFRPQFYGEHTFPRI